MPLEVPGEVGVVIETEAEGHFGGRGALEQQLTAPIDPPAYHIGVGAQAELALDAAHEVRDRASKQRCRPREVDLFGEMFVELP